MRHVSVLAVLLALVGALLSPPALAGEEPATTTPVDGRLVLDSSGSMQEPAPGGAGPASVLGLGAVLVAGAAGLGWWLGRRRGGASGG